MSDPSGVPSSAAIQDALQLAHRLVASGQPLSALKVVADLLRASGLEHEAGESVARVQQALAAGSASAGAADELAGLLSLVSLQAAAPNAQRPQPGSSSPAAQHGWQQDLAVSSGGGGPTGMDMDGGTGPGPPSGPGPPPAPSGAAADVASLAAQAEGASYVCQQCGGVVSVLRRAAHQQLWCPAAGLG